MVGTSKPADEKRLSMAAEDAVAAAAKLVGEPDLGTLGFGTGLIRAVVSVETRAKPDAMVSDPP
jgi:hypothetical protein